MQWALADYHAPVSVAVLLDDCAPWKGMVIRLQRNPLPGEHFISLSPHSYSRCGVLIEEADQSG